MDREEHPSNLARRLIADSAVLLPIATLWLYLIAIFYFRGYLGVYNVRPEWFSPSLFQLLAFSAIPICFALLLGAVFVYVMADVQPWRRGKKLAGRWKWAVAGWVVLYAIVAFFGFTGYLETLRSEMWLAKWTNGVFLVLILP